MIEPHIYLIAIGIAFLTGLLVGLSIGFALWGFDND